MFDAYNKEAEVALEIVQAAATLCVRMQAESIEHRFEKIDGSTATLADYASQAVMIRRLLTVFPEDVIVAEERSGELERVRNLDGLEAVTEYVRRLEPEANAEIVRNWLSYGRGGTSGRFWTLDPLDGTDGYLRGDQYSVALALIENGRVVLGALACPKLNRDLESDLQKNGTTFIAVRGRGSWMAGMSEPEFERLSVSERTEPSRARIMRSVEPARIDEEIFQAFLREFGTEEPPIKMDSQIKYAVVAAGGAEFYIRVSSWVEQGYREKIWDHAAGSILVEEAGGRVTDLKGSPLDFSSGRVLSSSQGVLISNSELHEDGQKAIARVLNSDQV